MVRSVRRIRAFVWCGASRGMEVGEPRQGVLLALHTYKNGRLRARPRLFPTRSTFFSTGMRHEHLLQTQTYNLGLSGPLSGRIQRHWAFPCSPPSHRQRDTCTCIPFDTSPSQETYRLSRLRGGLRFSCCATLSQLKVKTAAWPSVWRILLIP